jgi:glycosyltransferase involved in cell wall biosynthesis
MKRKLRIGIDASALLIAQKNGYENYVTNLVRALASLPSSELESLEIFLYFYGGNVLANSTLFEEYKPKLDKFHLRAYPFRQGFRQALPVMCLYDRLDLIHLPVYFWATKFPCRVITTFHDACHHRALLDGLVDEEPQDLVNSINRQIQISHAYIAVSNSSKRDLCDFYGIDPNRIWVVYHGVGDEYRNNTRAADVVRDKYGINRYILSVNSIQGNKNYSRLLEAYAQLFRQGMIKQSLVLVGRDGWGNDRIYRVLRDLGLDEQIHILGYVSQEELIGLYSGADIVVNASLCEGFGLPILEAMACGAVITASNNTALGEVGGEAVFGFDPYDVTSISNAIYEALFNAEARKIKQLASQVQIQKFSWERAASQTLNVYQSLLG